MKKTSFFLLLASLLLLASCRDIRKEYYPNGVLKQEIPYKNGKMNGLATWYFLNERKMMECTYVNGSIEGKITRWNVGGLIESEDIYKNNLRNGKCISYYDNGKIFIEDEYVNDKLNGTHIERHQNGLVKAKGHYKNGLYDGKWEYYDDRGIQVGEGNFVNGTGSLKGFYWNGRLKRIENFVDNKKEGDEIWYKENGEVEKVVKYKQDRIVVN